MSTVSLPAISELPEIGVDIASAVESATDLLRTGAGLAETVADAHDSWSGLRTSFTMTGLDERVWTGLDLVDAPAGSWRAAMVALQAATTALTGAASTLRSTVAELAMRRAGLMVATATATQQSAALIAAEIEAFNGECAQVNEDWRTAQETFGSELLGVRGGEADELPPGEARDVDGLDWGAVFENGTNESGMFSTFQSEDRYGDVWMILGGLNAGRPRRGLTRTPRRRLPWPPGPSTISGVRRRTLQPCKRSRST